MVVADLLKNVTIQGNVVITTFNEKTEAMVVLWETEDFEYEHCKIPYGIATMCIEYMYSVNSKKDDDDDEYGILVIEVVEEEKKKISNS